MWAQLVDVSRAVSAAAKRRTDPTGWLPRPLADVVRVLELDYRDESAAGSEVLAQRRSEFAELFALSGVEGRVVDIAVAAEIDQNFALAFGLLQGHDHAERATVALAMELTGHEASGADRLLFAPTAPLFRTLLLSLDDLGPLPVRRIHVADRVVRHLLGEDTEDPAIRRSMLVPVPVTFESTDLLAAHIGRGATLSYVHAPRGTAGLALAAGALARLDISYLSIALGPADVEPFRIGLRDATLSRRALLVQRGPGPESEATQALPGESDAGRAFFDAAADALVPVVVVGERPWQPGWLSWLPPVVEAEPLSERGRTAIFTNLLPALTADEIRAIPPFGLTPEQVRDVCEAAAATAAAHGTDPTVPDVVAAAQLAVGAGGDPPGVRRSEPAARFSDLMLAAATRQALDRIAGWTRNRAEVRARHRFLTAGGGSRGVAVLFTGPSGTGKTLAAQALAAELGVELLTVDLSAVVDKYIGETEKNLERVFRAAEIRNCVLFFDEADALFGSRSKVTDARDRYANQETAWLLQRIETFDGLAILATNLRANLDRAFTRRLHFVVPFDAPGPQLREALWRRFLADVEAVDPGDPMDIGHLAEHADLTGGEIRNIVLAAVHDALLTGSMLGMRQLLAATAREYDKLGRRLPAPLARST